MKLSDIPKETPQFWRRLAGQLCNDIRKRVQKQHRNVKSQAFDNYDPDYSEKKASGALRRKGTPQASRSTIPDMTFSGRTMADLKVHTATKDGATLGWWDVHGDIVRKLFKHKNYKIVDPDSKPYFSADEERYLETEINRGIDKRIKDYCSTPIIITGARV